MASEHWFRWHHGSVTDPKWRVIASRCVTNVTVGQVLAVWAAMLENASQASPRGSLDGWDDEDIATLFGFSIQDVSAIREAMQGKVLDGIRLIAWEKRQPKREDKSTDRTQAWRDKKRAVTQCDARERTVTLETETETETDKDQKILSVSAAPKPDGIPAEQILAAYRELLPDFPQPRKLDADRKKKITARWREDPERQSLGWWREFWGYVAKSDFLTGRSGKWSACNIDWLLQPANMRKVTEGNYENRSEA